jgi:hypothetical protein
MGFARCLSARDVLGDVGIGIIEVKVEIVSQPLAASRSAETGECPATSPGRNAASG